MSKRVLKRCIAGAMALILFFSLFTGMGTAHAQADLNVHASGAGGSADQFIKIDGTAVITDYDGSAPYPNHPTVR